MLLLKIVATTLFLLCGACCVLNGILVFYNPQTYASITKWQQALLLYDSITFLCFMGAIFVGYSAYKELTRQ